MKQNPNIFCLYLRAKSYLGEWSQLLKKKVTNGRPFGLLGTGLPKHEDHKRLLRFV